MKNKIAVQKSYVLVWRGLCSYNLKQRKRSNNNEITLRYILEWKPADFSGVAGVGDVVDGWNNIDIFFSFRNGVF